MSDRANFPPGEARDDWAIVRALSDRVGPRLPFDSLRALRQMVFADFPAMTQLDQAPRVDASALERIAALGGRLTAAPWQPAITDFYLTNAIARASPVMAECSALAAGRVQQAAE
jgi:NADH-quinone oxidoreductase subunit G